MMLDNESSEEMRNYQVEPITGMGVLNFGGVAHKPAIANTANTHATTIREKRKSPK